MREWWRNLKWIHKQFHVKKRNRTHVKAAAKKLRNVLRYNTYIGRAWLTLCPPSPISPPTSKMAVKPHTNRKSKCVVIHLAWSSRLRSCDSEKQRTAVSGDNSHLTLFVYCTVTLQALAMEWLRSYFDVSLSVAQLAVNVQLGDKVLMISNYSIKSISFIPLTYNYF